MAGMIRPAIAFIFLIANLAVAQAQERVVIDTQRLTDNGALFLAAAGGYFKAEGTDLGMTAYDSAQAVAETLASGATDFRLAGFTPAAFNLAGKGLIKAIAGQVREKRYCEGNQLVASNMGYNRGLHKFEDFANKTIAISNASSTSRYQLEQIARIKHIDLNRVTVKPMQTVDAIAHAVATGEVDGAIMAAPHARELLAASQARRLVLGTG
jgi:ABC-type nitrate/sulfonate/bicarbonate transport system substrate-binding protein